MAAGCIQESCIHERCLTPEDSAAAIGNSIPLRSTPFPIAEPYSKFSVFFDYTFLDNSKSYTPDGEVIVFCNNESSCITFPIMNAIADYYRICDSSNSELDLESFLKRASMQPYFVEQKHIAEILLSRKIEKDSSAPDWMKNADSWITAICSEPIFVYAPIHAQRQQAQSGRYILFPNKITTSIYDQSKYAFTSEIKPISKDNSCIKIRLIIPNDKKKKLLRELNAFGINKETLFPDNIDCLCESIKNNYKSLL